MRIYNSLSNQIEEFIPINENEVSMYVCGPTVYNHPHIGNARPLIVFDLVYRSLLEFGYTVKYLSNYTDIDDRIIDKAIEEGVSEDVISERYIKAYEDLSLQLNIMPVETIKVTDTIKEIVDFIEKLIKDGYAYTVSGDVYFRVSKVEDYGKLSNQKIDDLLVGARIEENKLKESPLDFTLWKQTSHGITFTSPWSKGRPGWHTECVVMINEGFNHTKIDIHGGGLDLKFPHHENEIAQAHTCGDGTLANYWMHNGLINIDGSKMSKSEGRMVLAKDMVDDLGYDVVRWLMLSSHYRAPLNLSDDYIKQSQSELTKVYAALNMAFSKVILSGGKWSDVVDKHTFDAFKEHLSDDFNTPNAYKTIFDTIKDLNQSLRSATLNYNDVVGLTNSVVSMLDILGIVYQFIDIDSVDIENYSNWQAAVAAKDYDNADIYRTKLMKKGIL